MLNYKVSTKAEKYFKKLKDKKLKDLYKIAITEIRRDPNIGDQKRHDLKGILSYDIYHNGINYEIAYTLAEIDGTIIIIILAGTRENFYDELKIYLKNCRNNFGLTGK